MKQLLKKIETTLFKLMLALFLFPASFSIFDFPQKWFDALLRGKYFFKVIKEAAPSLLNRLKTHSTLYRITIGLSVRIAVKLAELGSFKATLAYVTRRRFVQHNLWVKASPLVLLPGLAEGHPKAKEDAKLLLKKLPAESVSLAANAHCLFGKDICFAGCKVVIIAHWDPHNTIDPYVQQLARHFKEGGRKVIIASAAQSLAIAQEDSADWVDAIVYRTCTGYDFTSWKCAFEIFPSLYAAEELILTNDFYFGPLRSFVPVHEKMASVVCDFWGLVSSNQYQPHVQSYYLVFKKTVIAHSSFKEFFAHVPLSNSREAAIACELSLALWLALHGFQAAAFCTAPPQNKVNSSNAYWRDLIEAGLPILKREIIINPDLHEKSRGWAEVCASAGYPIEMVVSYLRRSGLGLHNSLPVVGAAYCDETQYVVHKALATLSLNAAAQNGTLPPVTVIIPVYNGLEHVRTLLPSLFQNTHPSARLLFVNDASPDAAVVTFLEQELSAFAHAELVHNEENLGFTRTVNRAMTMVQTPYTVLLNTDVIVPAHWLERLLAPFDKAANSIASSTPFTNAGVFFSFPQWCQDNVLLPAFTVEELDAAFGRLRAETHEDCDIHSGVGFCMAINMACWEAIGPLDAQAFGRGYGEECDWCMRAISKGWRNVLVPNLFVYHAHGGSFASEEKEKLCREHQAILQQRWPKIMAGIDIHVQQNPWLPYRTMASLLLSQGGKGCVLLVDLDHDSGGAIAYRKKKVKELSAQGWRVLTLKYNSHQSTWTLSYSYFDAAPPTALRGLYEMAFVFDALPIQKILVNNFAFYSRVEEVVSFFTRIRQKHALLMEYLLHDFLCICPAFFLMDADTKYCKTGSPERCPACLPHNCNRTVPYTDIEQWRNTWREFLCVCDTITCFSECTKNIFTSVYAMDEKIRVCEHEPLDDVQKGGFASPQKQNTLHIAYLGGLFPLKGSIILVELAELFAQNHINVKIHVFWRGGEYTAHKNLVNHGPYKRSELPALFAKNNISAVIFLSIWPETFSYVVQECMLMGVPLACFDLGAPAERLRKYNYTQCELVDETSATAMYHGLEKLVQREYGWTYEDFPVS